MNKKRLLVASNQDVMTYIKHGYTHFLCGDDRFSICGYGQMDRATLIKTVETIKSNGGDVLIYANRLIHEHELDAFDRYLVEVSKLAGVEGIVVGDHSALWLNQQHPLSKPLIYAPDTLMASTMDIQAALELGYDKVQIANELKFGDIEAIVDRFNDKVVIQTFGYLKSSMSARLLLRDYMVKTNQNIDLTNRNDLYLIESTRSSKMPIIQSVYGTTIFTDYIHYSPLKAAQLANVGEQWISTLFLDVDTVIHGIEGTLVDPRCNDLYWEYGSTITKEGS